MSSISFQIQICKDSQVHFVSTFSIYQIKTYRQNTDQQAHQNENSSKYFFSIQLKDFGFSKPVATPGMDHCF